MPNDWENPQVFKINKLPARAAGFPFADVPSALRRDPAASPWRQSLNDSWKFKLITNPLITPIQFWTPKHKVMEYHSEEIHRYTQSKFVPLHRIEMSLKD